MVWLGSTHSGVSLTKYDKVHKRTLSVPQFPSDIYVAGSYSIGILRFPSSERHDGCVHRFSLPVPQLTDSSAHQHFSLSFTGSGLRLHSYGYSIRANAKVQIVP